jgi:hypothetical protein
MLLLEGYTYVFKILRVLGTTFLYVEFSDFYVNQSLTGQTILCFIIITHRAIIK